MRTLRARGGELEREFAYGVVRQLFEGPLAAADPPHRERWLAGAAGLAAAVFSGASRARGGGGPDPGAILHGLYWLSANLAAEQPLLIASTTRTGRTTPRSPSWPISRAASETSPS